jgi:hypothetical protein
MGDSLAKSLPGLAEKFSSSFDAAIQHGALPHFKHEVSRAVEGLLGEAKAARMEIQISMIETQGPPEAVSSYSRRKSTEKRGVGPRLNRF